MHLNSTQVTGMIGLALAALVATTAFVRERQSGRTAWAIVAVIHFSLAIEVAAMIRHRIEAGVGNWLRAAGTYPERRPGQVALILVVAALALVLSRHVVRRATTTAQAVAMASTMALITLFAIESISLHAIDAILYASAGPILVVGWLWLASATITSAAAISAARTPSFSVGSHRG